MATNLFSLLKTSGLGELSNRVVMAPLTRGRAGVTRVPNDYMRQYYEERASAGLIITEATAISEKGYGWLNAPGLYTEEHAKEWSKITDAVHKKGGKIFLQLWHMGRASHSSYQTDGEIIGPSAIAAGGEVINAQGTKVPNEIPREITLQEIPKIIQEYQHSSQLARQAGFDGVEIHSANGYLIDQFLQSVSNHRTDSYGGNYENRYRFLKEVVEAVGQVWNYNQIGVRLSPNGLYNGMGSEDNHEMFPFVAKQLSQYGLAYLHVMDGLEFGFHGKCRAITLHDMKSAFQNGHIISNVGISKAIADGLLRSGSADLIAFGRPYLSNPDLVERLKNNWPLNDVPDWTTWYGFTPDPKDSLKGYLGYPIYVADKVPADANDAASSENSATN